MLPEEFHDLNDTIYPSIGRRFLAALVDALIFLSLLPLVIYINRISRLNIIYTSIIHTLIGLSYYIYFMNRFGATLGKMFLKIKVVKINGQKIGLKEALLRCSVRLIFGLLIIAVSAFVLSNMTDEMFHSTDFRERIKWRKHNQPFLGELIKWALYAWNLSNIIAIFCNKRKRALHDYIAGTVVIKTQYQEYAEQYSQNVI